MIPDNFRLIATSAAIVRAFGPAAAIWLGNAISSQDWSISEHRDPWWWARKSDIEDRTGLSDEIQETSRKRLREAGILHEKRGLVKRGASLATIWYCIDFDALQAVIESRPARRSSTENPLARLPVSAAGDPYASVASSSTHLGPAAPGQEKAKKQRKEKQPFVPPTVDEWISLFKERWPWVPTTRVRLSWQHYEDASWKRNDGTPIVNWKLAANTSYGFWLKDNPSEEAAWRRRNESEARQKPVSLAPSPVAGRHAIHTDMSVEMGDLMEKALRMAKERGQGRVSAITIFQNELGGHFE